MVRNPQSRRRAAASRKAMGLSLLIVLLIVVAVGAAFVLKTGALGHQANNPVVTATSTGTQQPTPTTGTGTNTPTATPSGLPDLAPGTEIVVPDGQAHDVYPGDCVDVSSTGQIQAKFTVVKVFSNVWTRVSITEKGTVDGKATIYFQAAVCSAQG